MTTASGNFAELLWPGIEDIWGKDYNDYEALYTKMFEVKSSDKRFEKEQGVTGLGLAGIKDEGAAVNYDDPFQGFQKEYVNATYSLGTIVTREMYEDEMYSYINSIPKMLSKSLRQTEETIAHNHLNNGFNSSFTGADGPELHGEKAAGDGLRCRFGGQRHQPDSGSVQGFGGIIIPHGHGCVVHHDRRSQWFDVVQPSRG